VALLTKASILASKDLKTETVDVPEWGGQVTIRTMTGADRDAFENSLFVMDGNGTRRTDMTNMRAKLVALTVVDDSGNPMFTLQEAANLGEKSSAALQRIFAVAQALNGMGTDGLAAAEKNSKPEPSAVSTSA
jgi:hypothetical protein